MGLGTRLHWRRVAAAAIRLAALYAVGAISLLLLLGILVEGPPPLRDVADLALPFGVLFLLACLILVLARRAGFAALWILLVGLWVWMLRDNGFHSDVPKVFTGWTILALPLFAIGALGTSGQHSGASIRVRVPRALIVLAVWLLIAGLALRTALGAIDMYFLDAPDPVVSALSRFVWIPAPFVIAALEVTRVWLATSPRTGVSAELPKPN